VADLSGADGGAAEPLDNGGDLASGHPLDVHLGQDEFEGLFAEDALIEGAGIEVWAAADLSDIEGDRTNPAVEALGLVAIGVADTGVCPLVGFGFKELAALMAGGFVDEHANPVGYAFDALSLRSCTSVFRSSSRAWWAM